MIEILPVALCSDLRVSGRAIININYIKYIFKELFVILDWKYN